LSEIRTDPISGHSTIFAPGRARRVNDYGRVEAEVSPRELCPFCEGHEWDTPEEVLAYRADTSANGPGWTVRVFPNKYPAVTGETGRHEVVIESPDHGRTLSQATPGQAAEVLRALKERILAHRKNPAVKSVTVFKNHGPAAGATRVHPHFQLLAMPNVPRRLQEELARGREWLRENERCYWCGLFAAPERIVFETREFVVLTPFAARFPFETWILPRRHLSHFETSPDTALADLSRVLPSAFRRMERLLKNPPHNAVLVSAPIDEDVLPHFHWRIELIPRLTTLAGFELGTGCYINSVLPEEAARKLGKADRD